MLLLLQRVSFLVFLADLRSRIRIADLRTRINTARCIITVAGIFGFAIGSGISWYISKLPTPWLEFEWLTASYSDGGEIKLIGRYRVNRECIPIGSGGVQVIWWATAVEPSGKITFFGPGSDHPMLLVGRHEYSERVSFPSKTPPKDWHATVIVTCPGGVPETVVSPSALVIISDGLP